MAGRGGRDFDGRDREWDRDPYRRTNFAGSRASSSHDDLHYDEWRRRQMEDLDRDYDDYRRERQSHFEDDFGNWRQRRMSKRELLRDIREHMEVVGSDDEHVGTVDRVAGDRIILTRSDPQSGGVHHSLSCADVDRIEGDRVILDCNAEKARERWRDERPRAGPVRARGPGPRRSRTSSTAASPAPTARRTTPSGGMDWPGRRQLAAGPFL